MDYAIGGQARLLQTRCEQILLRHTPQNFALRACRDASNEASGGGSVDRAIPAAGDLMQASKRQPATG
jgi:hypothetical protein